MEIHNLLPKIEEFISSLENKDINFDAFKEYYLSSNNKSVRYLFENINKWQGIRKQLGEGDKLAIKKRLVDLKNWGYPARAEATIEKVEKFYKKKLNGELILFFGLNLVDGYTRFEKGWNTIFLGVDYSEYDANDLDILLAHELNHLTRDSSEQVLHSYGVTSEMTNKEYLSKMTFVEHLVNEGLAGYFSSLIYPEAKPWKYLYYSKKQYDWCLNNHKEIEKLVINHIEANKSWRPLYRENLLGDSSPERLQYYYGLELIKKASKKYPLNELIFMPAKDIVGEFCEINRFALVKQTG
ncbi:MAG: hypothetical protein COU81_02865 [Candidatus Portnoybacteria bacterium CG10_big_fil_rev_8_21_14_0_10_36_7]|uniref:DUF2268 domain-containing protein n=1 Tax=Candidatus Portnoybacteria bacterium CG10_big_fil_rev_8_21_14_0_10_36_7 TaxID=1974812 RepID=A0A2M8KDQ9_9BACT|nr:MAG: hypothetical protein COU81_02865 [Candidatus Portnoybacteria bacterium CG10_big_fil_rev_8_21_14_0_10_36_7]